MNCFAPRKKLVIDKRNKVFNHHQIRAYLRTGSFGKIVRFLKWLAQWGDRTIGKRPKKNK